MTRGRKIIIAAALLLGLPLVWLTVEHVRGKWALAAWEKAARARGEKLDLSELTPAPLPPERNGAEQFLAAASLLKQSTAVAAVYSPVSVTAGKTVWMVPREEWRELVTGIGDPDGTNSNWQYLSAAVSNNAPHLANIHAALQKGELQLFTNYSAGFDTVFTFLPGVKSAARWLGIAALTELHAGRREAAWQALVDSAELARQQRGELFMINQLVRIAGARGSMDAAWQALQENGWTDAQLQELQRAWNDWSFSETVPWVNRLERAGLCLEIEKSRHNPKRLLEIQNAQEMAEGMVRIDGVQYERGWVGEKIGPLMDELREKARPVIYAPLWSIAWADQDKLLCMKIHEQILKHMEKAANERSLDAANLLKTESENDFRPREKFSYRFTFSEMLVPGIFFSYCVKAADADCRREMLVAAIALKRHHVRHGRYPEKLEALVPEFLTRVPHDFMNGQPLRYRLKADGTYLLYSVGEDGNDNDGDGTNVKAETQRTRDIVWPWPATEDEIAAYLAEKRKTVKK